MKTLCLFLLFVATMHLATAQELRLNFYSAYVFDDSFDSYYDNDNYYDGKIKGGYQWGAGLEYFIRPEYGVELMYLNQKTTAPTEYKLGLSEPLERTNFDLGLSYIMLGGNRYKTFGEGKAEGFGGLMAGMAIANLDNPDNGRSSSATKFAWGARLGVNVWVSEKVGIKLQAQILSIVQAAGGGFYFGTGGSGAGVSTYSTFYQFGLGGGLTFRVKGGTSE